MQITKKRSSLDNSCSICLSEHDDNSIQVLCAHRFHDSCINRWLSGANPTCPLCRQIIVLSSESHNIVQPDSVFDWMARTLEYQNLIDRENQEREIMNLLKITSYVISGIALGVFACYMYI